MKSIAKLVPMTGLVLLFVVGCSSNDGKSGTEVGAPSAIKQALTSCAIDEDCPFSGHDPEYCGIDGYCYTFPDQGDECAQTVPCLWTNNPCREGHSEGDYCTVGAHCVPTTDGTECKLDLPCTSNANCNEGIGEYCNADDTCHGYGG